MQRLFLLVQKLYQERYRERGSFDPADAQILPDAENGRLIVTARAEHLKAVETILAQLAPAARTEEVRETRVYDLTTASAAELAAFLGTYFSA